MSAPPRDGPVIGIVAALPLELAPFRRRCQSYLTETGNGFTFRGLGLGERRIVLVEGATGAERAKQAAHALLDAYQPAWVISAGFAGALQPQIKVGDIVTGNQVVSATGPLQLSIDVGMPANPQAGQHVGRLCTAPNIIRTALEKRELAGTSNALAVDLETLHVAQVCSDRRVRFVGVRAISDDAQTDLPPEVMAVLGSKGSIRAGALVSSILRRPGSVKDLWSLREKALLAADHLGQFLAGVVRQLPLPG